MIEPQQKKWLEQIKLALLANHNCLITDRPDLINKLPQSVVFWTTDFGQEIKLVDALLNNDSGHECTGRNTDLLNEPT